MMVSVIDTSAPENQTATSATDLLRHVPGDVYKRQVAALSLVNAQSALAANESAKDMTCQEFIDLNPKAMTPVSYTHLDVYKRQEISR